MENYKSRNATLIFFDSLHFVYYNVRMKIIFYSDVHFSTYSSIFRKRGKNYSARLESCINSVGWAEDYAERIGADLIVIGGDFFDRSDLSAEELTALKEVYFSQKINHVVLVGNHEMKTRNRSLTSAHLFQTLHGVFNVFDSPVVWNGSETNMSFNCLYLPYINEEERHAFVEYLPKNDLPSVVFSHNDIAGIQLGQFTSKEGFSLNDIEKYSALFINGHLHNGMFLNKQHTICNVGNLTGKDFGENGFQFKHQIAVIDTDKLSIELVDNPYAAYFYKLDFHKSITESEITTACSSLAPISCITCNVEIDDVQVVKSVLDNLPSVVDYRLIATKAQGEQPEIINNVETFASIDHIASFKDYVRLEIGKSELLEKELQELV